MFERMLNALGRGIMAAFLAIWRGMVVPAIDAVGQGIAAIIRAVLQWIIAAAVMWYMIVYQPEIANQLLIAAVILAVVWLGFRLMFKRPGGQNRRH